MTGALEEFLRKKRLTKPQCNCNVSTGTHEGLTYGKGKLDDYGYWSRPCQACARYAEKRDNKPINTYWPFQYSIN